MQFTEQELLECCGSQRWAERMAHQRPFQDRRKLLKEADRIWWELDPRDWLEAFRRHPRIGEKSPAVEASRAGRWSKEEQSGTRGASPETLAALREANHEYEARFGYIFIVCAAGKSAEEMLALVRERLRNDRETELRIAAEEQRRITRLRLEKLLTS